MKSFVNAILIVSIFFYVACEKSQDFPDIAEDNNKHANIFEAKDMFINLNEAEFIATEFINKKQGVGTSSTKTRSNTLLRTSVVTSQAKTRSGGAEKDTLMYIFNFTEGFAIVSATRAIYPILAYSDENSFDENDTDNVGLLIWLENTKENVERLVKNPERNANNYKPYLEVFAESDDKKGIVTRSTTITNYIKVGPLVTTNWHQDNPYNQYTPLVNGIKAPTGCVPIAIAQVVNYYKRLNGENIDWTAINNENGAAIANLIHIISDGIQMSYKETYAHPQFCIPNIFCYRARVENYLQAKGYNASYGYNLNKHPISCPTVVEGFTANFVGGANWFGGHWWVLDGYESYNVEVDYSPSNCPRCQGTGCRFCEKPPIAIQSTPGGNSQLAEIEPESEINSYNSYGVLFFHFNWGQVGNSNGWYGVFDSYTYYGYNDNTVYSKNIQRYNITKK